MTWSRAELTGQDREEWAKRIGALGIDQDTHVVVYDDNFSKDAARIWWILRYWGIRDVRLLNGGWHAWETSGGPMFAVIEKVPIRVPSLSADGARLATKDQVLAALKEPRITIVDARSQGEYCGEEKTAKRNGAIPGAIHLEWLEVLDAKSQRFKTPEELAELLKKRRHRTGSSGRHLLPVRRTCSSDGVCPGTDGHEAGAQLLQELEGMGQRRRYAGREAEVIRGFAAGRRPVRLCEPPPNKLVLFPFANAHSGRVLSNGNRRTGRQDRDVERPFRLRSITLLQDSTCDGLREPSRNS